MVDYINPHLALQNHGRSHSPQAIGHEMTRTEKNDGGKRERNTGRESTMKGSVSSVTRILVRNLDADR